MPDFSGQLQIGGADNDYSPRLVRGRDVDISAGFSELTNTNLVDADLFLVDDVSTTNPLTSSASPGMQSGTKKILASSMKTYFQTGLQTTLTFGKSSGNALKSEEALATGDVLLMGTNHVQGLPPATFKTNLAILGLEGGTLTGQLKLDATDGNSAPSTDGHILDTDNTTFNDATTSASGTVSQFYTYKLSKATLTATNASITTTDATTLYLEGATVASTNQTITNNYALQLGGGNIKLPNDSKILFGDAGEYIKGDGTDLTIASSGDMVLDCNGGDVTIVDSGTATPTLTLSNTSDTYGTPPVISFLVNPSNNVGEDGDDLGRIDFKGDDDGGNVTTYTQIVGEISDASDGTEDGKLSFKVALNNTLTTALEIKNSSSANTSEITLGNDSSSGIIFSGTTSFGGTLTLNNQRLVGAQRVGFDDGGYITEFIDTDDMSGATSTKASSSESIKAYVDASSKFFLTSAFYHGSSNLEYIPIAGGSTSEQPSLYDYANDDTTFIVPYNLKINTIYVCATRANSSGNIAGNTRIMLHKNYSALSGNVTVAMSTIGYDSTDLATVYTFDFSGETNTYSAGDIMQISIDPLSTLYYVSITIVGLYT
jgi:hypothetical protein